MRTALLLLPTILLFSSLAVGQAPATAADAERLKKKKELDQLVARILDQTIADAGGLRLHQNRAVAYAMAGNLYWKFDDKRSRELFRSAAGEIVAHNLEVEREKLESAGSDPYMYVYEFVDPNDVRPEVLPIIAVRDAGLALELLVQTRSAALAAAMARAGESGSQAGDFGTFNPASQRVSQEVALEQRLLMMAAGDDPEKTVALIKDSLARGVSYNILPLLQKLHKKDAKKALDLGAEVLSKLAASDLAKSPAEMRTALNFLQYAVRPPAAPNAKEPPFVFPEAEVKELALTLAGVLLLPAKSMAMASMLNSALPTLEKLVPERAAALKQRAAANKKNLPDEYRAREQRERLMNPNLTAEQLVAEVRKISNENERVDLYRNLISKINQITDDARANRLIDQIPDERFRLSAREQYDSLRAGRVRNTGQFDEARKMASALSDKNQKIRTLVSIAVQMHRRGGAKNVESANEIMTEAKLLTNQVPQNEDELAGLMDVVNGYTTVDRETAFQLFEPVIEQFNEMVHAGAILSKYNKRDRTYRNGELVIRMNGFSGAGIPLFRYLNHLQTLGRTDFERMNTLADRFARNDTRTIVKLHILQGFIR